MTAESRRGLPSATNDPLQLPAQRLTRQTALLLVPALAAVPSARISFCVEAAEGSRWDTLVQEPVAQPLCQAVRQIVLLHGHDPPLLFDAHDEIGRKLREWESPHAPDLEIVEQVFGAHLIEIAHHWPQPDDHGRPAALD